MSTPIFSSERVAEFIRKCDGFAFKIKHFVLESITNLLCVLEQDVGVCIDYKVQEGASVLSSKSLASTTMSSYLLSFFTPFSHRVAFFSHIFA